MLDRARERARASLVRVRRLERREMREFRAWLENTRNLIHLTVLVLVPLLIALVTLLSNAVRALPFVLFPPLASGTYTLFSDPEGRFASPTRFVGGLTAGALCGAIGLWLVTVAPIGAGTTTLGGGPGPFAVRVSPLAAGVAVFLTGALTWAADVEEPSAFATALLALVARPDSPELYVASIAAASAVVAAVFFAWRERFYEQRERYLYRSTKGDDHVLVPMRGEYQDATAMLGARLAAAHDAGKVVLVGAVEDEDVAAAARTLLEGEDDPAAVLERAADGGPAAGTVDSPDGDEAAVPGDGSDADPEAAAELVALAEERAAAEAAMALEAEADRIETAVGVPCQVAITVEADDVARSLLRTAHETNCDLVVVPYEEQYGGLAPYIRDLFRGDTDVLVHRATGRTEWRDVLVPVRKTGDTAHAMIDFARRLAGATGRISVCHCIGRRGSRRRAENMLADLVETVHGKVESRVPRRSVEEFLADDADAYDLLIMGASQDRSAASRFISPPTFERIHDLECDVAIMDRNYRY
jgi:hypothetical protein